MSDREIYDITLIGAGPVGLFGCFYAGMRGMKTRVMDSLPEAGGQLTALYPEKYIFDMPGFPKILARDLAQHMIEQGMRFNPTLTLGERAQSLQRVEDGLLEITGESGETYLTRTLVICAGAGAFAPKKLTAPGMQDFEGRGVHYYVHDRKAFTGRRVVIVGGGDSALDWAQNLSHVAKSVTVAHRRDVFRAHEDSVDWLLNRSQVQTRLFREVDRLEGNHTLERAILTDSRTGEQEIIEIDDCIITIGFTASIGPLRTWGLELEGPQIRVNERMETNLPGVFAAGDICIHPNKLKLIATGVGEVCTAVNVAKTWIDPSARAFPGHSSNMQL